MFSVVGCSLVRTRQEKTSRHGGHTSLAEPDLRDYIWPHPVHARLDLCLTESGQGFAINRYLESSLIDLPSSQTFLSLIKGVSTLSYACLVSKDVPPSSGPYIAFMI